MRVDLPPSDMLKDLKASVGSNLTSRLGKPYEFRVHPSLTFALNEVTRGLARLFPHRRSIAYVKGCGPYFEPLMNFFSAEGFNQQAIPFADLNKPDWIAALKNDTLFVLLSDDDPLTGQLFEIPEIQKALEAKRIFSVVSSHAVHSYRDKWPMSPYLVRVMSGGPMFALSVLGERASKIEPLLFGPADWASGLMSGVTQFFTEKKEAREAIEKFEALAPGGGKSFFSGGVASKANEGVASRLYDRAALYWDDMDGEAFIHELALLLNVSLLVPGNDNLLETASLCRWKGLKTLQWLSEQSVSADISRGLVLISKDLINADLVGRVEKARATIFKMQNG